MTDPKPTHVQPRPTLQPAPTFTRWADAYDAYKDLIAAVSDDTLLHINVDIASVVTMICGAWPQIEVLRPQLATLPAFDPVMFERVEGLALALAHTQAMYLSASTPVGTLPALQIAAPLWQAPLLGGFLQAAQFPWRWRHPSCTAAGSSA